jgi:hypothetical protein
MLKDGTKTSIPRYYEKWFKQHHPEKWVAYVTKIKQDNIDKAVKKEELITLEEKKSNLKRSSLKGLQKTRNYMRNEILEKKFNEQLQSNLKI